MNISFQIETSQKNENVINTRLTRSRARNLGIIVNVNSQTETSSSNKAVKRKLSHENENVPLKKKKLNDEQIDRSEFPASTALVPLSQQIAPNSMNDAQLVDTIALITFKVDEVVWAKIKGHPHWPAKIKCFPNAKMAIVVWFNDYRTTKVYRTQLHKFLINFDKFAVRFSDSIGLKTAAQEALIYFGHNVNANMQF